MVKIKQKKLFSMILTLTGMLTPLLAQQSVLDVNVERDTSFAQFSLQELETFRTQYTREISRLESDRLELLNQGIKDSKLFLSRNPDSKTADRVLMRLAQLYYDQAQADFEVVMTEYDRLYELYDRGQIDNPPNEPRKNFRESLHTYAMVIEDYPESEYVDDALYHIGYLLEETGHLDSAFTFYDKTLNEFPTSELVPDLLMRIGEYYFNPPNNLVEIAITYYERILQYKTSPRYDEALYRLGWCYYRMSEYDKAITYFTLLADDIERSKPFDPNGVYTNPSLSEESIEYIGLSFLEKGGAQAAADYLQQIGGRSYGVDVLKRIGDVYLNEKEEYQQAIDSYNLLLDLYPDVKFAPLIQNKIVVGYRRLDESSLAFLARERLYHLYRDGSDWWKKNDNTSDREIAYALTESALRDNITFLTNTALEENRSDIYYQVVVESEKYLRSFASDSSAPLIHWNMALTYDTKLNQFDRAFDEYIKVSNDYWGSRYQRYAAKNAVALARDAAMSDISSARVRAEQQEPVSLSDLKKSANQEGVQDLN
ncbi:tetratricopeptide repeat protein, partial [bacterium]|nr:tetratricopeptide repeat protein [candidate division CSSED10-310 bacterium]